MATMECVELRAPGGEFAVGERSIPDPGRGEVLVDVAATGVGHTVYNKLYRTDRVGEAQVPLIPGHELVGTAVEVGDDVSHVSEGDLVTAYYYLCCGHCAACVAGREAWCEQGRDQIGVEVDGGYAEYIALPGPSVVDLPPGLDPVGATVITDALGTPYHICSSRAEVEPGDRVLVLGAGGGVGIHFVQMARAFGAEVTAVDQGEAKLQACAEAGAAHLVDTTERSVADDAQERGVDYDVIADFTGVDGLVAEALDTLALGGRFVNLTTVLDGPVEVTPEQLVAREVKVVGSRYCSRDELRRAADLVASGAIEPVVTEVVGLDGVADLLERIVAGEVVGRGAVRPRG